VADLTVAETVSIAPLMVLALVVGLFPRFLLDLVEPAARALGVLVAR
jgi:NADH-quinone oxidoreductase subunit M